MPPKPPKPADKAKKAKEDEKKAKEAAEKAAQEVRIGPAMNGARVRTASFVRAQESQEKDKALDECSGDVTWLPFEQSGEIPPPRSGHTMTVTDRLCYVFGGCGVNGEEAIVYNDLHVLDLGTGVWSRVEFPMENAPSPRWGHSCNAVSQHGVHVLVVFGGITQSAECPKPTRLNDLYLFDVEKRCAETCVCTCI